MNSHKAVLSTMTVAKIKAMIEIDVEKSVSSAPAESWSG